MIDGTIGSNCSKLFEEIISNHLTNDKNSVADFLHRYDVLDKIEEGQCDVISVEVQSELTVFDKLLNKEKNIVFVFEMTYTTKTGWKIERIYELWDNTKKEKSIDKPKSEYVSAIEWLNQWLYLN